MQDGKTLATYLLSAAALLGPLAYILFAFHEMGRLNFFEAPIEFLQISSFGILPVILTVYPAIVITFIVLSIVSGIKVAAPRPKVILAALAFTIIALILFSLSMTSFWRWIFNICIGLGVFIALAVKEVKVEFGSEADRSDANPNRQFLMHLQTASRNIIFLCGASVFLWCFWAVGKKDAATAEYYWVTGGDVVIGFYGDQVLLGERRGLEVGPKFRLVELKSLEGSLTRLRVGPLQAASMWKSSSPAERSSECVDSPGPCI